MEDASHCCEEDHVDDDDELDLLYLYTDEDPGHCGEEDHGEDEDDGHNAVHVRQCSLSS